MHHNRQRRKKQRPNYGKRVVDVCRSINGFGFTISGQKPCILSCIVKNSPADLAGLRAGDFLMSVNNANVSKLPHEVVVQLINNSMGTIRLAIAENYFSDSSDDETATGWQNENVRLNDGRGRRPKYPHHKVKLLRSQQQQQLQPQTQQQQQQPQQQANPNRMRKSTDEPDIGEMGEDMDQGDNVSAYNIIHSVHANNDRDINNVSAMVSSTKSDTNDCDEPNLFQLEYRTVVGYLGTIEMPKQIVSNSKFQTVRSCIRKMRQEKRQPTVVLMQILPNCLKLYNVDNVLLAKYPAGRLSYVSSNHSGSSAGPAAAMAVNDGDMRFFGLVTSATYADGRICDWASATAATSNGSDVVVSNSCHVFVIDFKLIDHAEHFTRAEQFSIVCTKDPVTNCCLEFPSTSDYVVNLIRSMYALNGEKPPQIPAHGNGPNRAGVARVAEINAFHAQPMNNQNGGQNSPQPSNHSEVTTASSNSDSGIGFHNDFTNISDRIVVVDFPQRNGPNQNRAAFMNNAQRSFRATDRPLPFGVESVRNIRSTIDNNNGGQGSPKPPIFHAKSRSLDYTLNNNNNSNRGASTSGKAMPSAPVHLIRAMPDRMPSQIKMPLPERNNDCTSLPTSPEKYDRYERIFGTDSERTVSNQTTDNNSFNAQSDDEISESKSKSCDDLMMSVRHKFKQPQFLASFDDVSLLGDAPPPPPPPPPPLPSRTNKTKKTSNIDADHNDDYVFLAPQAPSILKKTKKKQKKPTPDKTNHSFVDEILSYKLSPKVFGVSKPHHGSNKELSKAKRRLSIESKENANGIVRSIKNRDFSVWGSLQDLEILNRLEINQQTADQRTVRRDFLEPAYSEPDLLTRILPNNSSPFRRWGQSSFRSRSNDPNHANLFDRRPASVVASENDVYSKSVEDADRLSLHSRNSDMISSTNLALINQSTNDIQTHDGVQAWGNSFEKLLEDASGLHTFAVFLQKEFSAENIYFWTACERFRTIEDHAKRTQEANKIFSKHLAVGASDPVNVDSKARTLTQEKLGFAEKDLFAQAQKQIFNLMKFDSYQRFIRSDLYKNCLAAENMKQPLPYPGHLLDPNLRITMETIEKPTTPATKLKKSYSNAEDRRRKSLLPWHRKTRCKSKDRHDTFLGENNCGSLKKSATTVIHSNHTHSDVHSSRSSLSSFDAVLSARSNGTLSPNASGDDSPPRSSLCRVILTDGATTIVQTRHHESIRNLVDRLLEKRAIFYQAYEGFVSGTSKPIDLSLVSTTLAGKEVLIEQRVVFKLDLPNKKIISVKSKPCKMLGEVLRPILQKYNYQLETVTVFTKNSSESLSMNNPVTSTDGLRLQVVFNDDAKVTSNQSTLHEITNKVFNELMQQKTDAQLHCLNDSQITLQPPMTNQSQQKRLSDTEDIGGRSDEWCSESSSGRQQLIKGRTFISSNKQRKFSEISSIPLKTSSNDVSMKTSHDCNSSIASGILTDETCKKPLIAKWKAGVRIQNTASPTTPDSKDLLEGLKRAQRFRLEDQRGTEINFELPDFLKDNKLKNGKLDDTNSENNMRKSIGKTPQPAPRLSIGRNNNNNTLNESGLSLNMSITSSGSIIEKSPRKENDESQIDGNVSDSLVHRINGTLPPPLPPKPRIKPTIRNNAGDDKTNGSVNLTNGMRGNVKGPIAERINMLTSAATEKKMPPPRTIYFDQLNSSFV